MASQIGQPDVGAAGAQVGDQPLSMTTTVLPLPVWALFAMLSIPAVCRR